MKDEPEDGDQRQMPNPLNSRRSDSETKKAICERFRKASK